MIRVPLAAVRERLLGDVTPGQLILLPGAKLGVVCRDGVRLFVLFNDAGGLFARQIATARVVLIDRPAEVLQLEISANDVNLAERENNAGCVSVGADGAAVVCIHPREHMGFDVWDVSATTWTASYHEPTRKLYTNWRLLAVDEHGRESEVLRSPF